MLVAVLLGWAGGPAFAQELPPAAQPGATQPRDLTSPLPEIREPFRFEIPPVIERPLGVDEGARVFVHAFEIRGILQDPNAPDLAARARAGVEREFNAALAAVEAQRQQRQQLDVVGDDGFTEEERQRVVEFMRGSLDMEQDERIAAYERLVSDLELARLERNAGLTIGQIQQVADAVTAIYQQAGYFLARAVVPAQEVTDGVVVIQVLEGRMGTAIAENNTMYSDRLLVRPFAGLEGRLITAAAMEDALLVLSDYPGLQAFGTFRPGEAVGTADIVVGVQNEDRVDFASRLDNHGTDLTGEYRLALTMDVNNPLRKGDRLSVTMMRTFRPSNTTLGQLGYRLPLRDPRNRLVLDLARNAFDISGGLITGLSGLSNTALLGYERVLVRSRNLNWYAQADFSRKRGETLNNDLIVNQDDLAVLGLQVRFDRVISADNVIESGFLRLDHGFDGRFGVPESAEIADPTFQPRPSRAGSLPEFDKVTTGYSRLKAVTPRHSLLLRLTAQWTDDLLAPLEQFSVGGANQVRALPVSHQLGDRGAFGSAEWTMRMGQRWSAGLFYDHAVAWENEPLNPADEKFSKGGWGVALGFSVPGSWNFKLQHARVNGGADLTAPLGDPNRIESSHQTWADLSYRF